MTTIRVTPLREKLIASQAQLATLLTHSDQAGVTTGNKPNWSWTELDREQFATALRRLLKSAGIEDPIWDPYRRFFFDRDSSYKQIRAHGENSLIAQAAQWMKDYGYVKVLERRIEDALAGRPFRDEPPKPKSETERLAEQIKLLEARLIETSEPKRLRRSSPKKEAPKATMKSEHALRRDEGRDRYNTERGRAANAWLAQAQLRALDYWKVRPTASKREVAIVIAKEFEKQWRAILRQAEERGEKPPRHKPPGVERIRQTLVKPK